MLYLVGGVVCLGVCVGVVAAGARILQVQSDGLWTKRYVAVIPLPAARVHGEVVLYRDVLDRWETVDRFLEMRPLDTPEGQTVRPRHELRKEAYEQLIREAYIQALAKEESFTVTQQVIDTNVQNLLDQASSTLRETGSVSSTRNTPPTTEEMNAYLMATFGWTFDQFRDRILIPALREDGLSRLYSVKNGTTVQEWQAEVEAFIASDKVRRYLKF